MLSFTDIMLLFIYTPVCPPAMLPHKLYAILQSHHHSFVLFSFTSHLQHCWHLCLPLSAPRPCRPTNCQRTRCNSWTRIAWSDSSSCGWNTSPTDRYPSQYIICGETHNWWTGTYWHSNTAEPRWSKVIGTALNTSKKWGLELTNYEHPYFVNTLSMFADNVYATKNTK